MVILSIISPRSECELRFQDNSIFAQESQTMTVKDFYHYYLNRPDRYHLTTADKNIKMAKGTFIPLDVYIHDQRVSKLVFNARLQLWHHKQYLQGIQQGLDMVTSIQGASSKRSGPLKNSSTVKRTKLGKSINNIHCNVYIWMAFLLLGPLISTFEMDRPSTFAWGKPRKEDIPTITVSFSTITCDIDPITSKPSLVESEHPQTGDIGQKPMALSGADKGRSKNVYKVWFWFLFDLTASNTILMSVNWSLL